MGIPMNQPMPYEDIRCNRCGHHLSIGPWLQAQHVPVAVVFKCECGYVTRIERALDHE